MRTVEVLGVGIDALTESELFDDVFARVRAHQRSTVMYANVHVLNLAHRDAALRAALAAADLVYCDGAGVMLAARLLGDRLPARITGADFVWNLGRRCAAERAPVYWLGGAPGVAAGALERIAARAPGFPAAGAHDGMFDKAAESARVIAELNAARPAIVMVGMGSPLQEHWVARHRAAIQAPVVWCIGATADFVVGAQRRGHPLLTQHGLEWLARLADDPRRLFRRYVIGNPVFVGRVLRERARRRRGVG